MSDIHRCLKLEAQSLEQHHQVIIPDDIYELIYQLNSRHVPSLQIYTQTLRCLDSLAALESHPNKKESEQKPVLTNAAVIRYLSLKLNLTPQTLTFKYRPEECQQILQQGILGQEQAIRRLCNAVRHKQLMLQKNAGPVLSFLFAGPPHVGKKHAATILNNYLFHKQPTLYQVNVLNTPNELLIDTQAICHHTGDVQLIKNIITCKPHAMLLFENIEFASQQLINDLNLILQHGELHHDNITHSFRQSTIIMTTQLGKEQLQEIDHEEDDSFNERNLFQLVTSVQTPHYQQAEERSLGEEEIRQLCWNQLKLNLTESIIYVPFFALKKASLSQIIQTKLNHLSNTMRQHHHIDLSYATEVVGWLTRLAAQKKTSHWSSPIDYAFRSVYECIENTLITFDKKKRLAPLHLQLDETGVGLRCECIAHRDIAINQ